MHVRRLRRPLAAALLAAAVGFAALGLASPAAAATTPTISAPASRTGFGPVTLTGTAQPGATVTLIEAAYVYRGDLNPAVDYNTGDVVTATSNSSGHYSIERNLDSGFVFAVEAGGLRSSTVTVSMRVRPTIKLTSTGSGTLSVDVAADPGQPWLPVQVQRVGSGGTWAVQASGSTGADGGYSTVLTGQGSASQRYRAYIGGDAANAVLANYSAVVDSPGTAPRAGDVQFSKIVYNSPGTDNGSNTSLNGEYVRFSNKTTRTIDLKYWTIRDAGGHVYTFSGSYLLGAGKTRYLHTGKGTNGKPDSQHRYWGRTSYVWNNGGDTATLRSSSDKAIDSCRWGNGSGTTYC
jgi:hypothetical protein